MSGKGGRGKQEGKHPNNNNKSNLEIKVLKNEITEKKLKELNIFMIIEMV